MLNMQIFSERLKASRQKKGLSQAELGKKLGLTAATIGSYESAKNAKIPSLDKAFAIAEALDVTIDWLCGIEKEKNNTVCGFTAKEYLYSLVRVITEMSSGLSDSLYAGEYALHIAITQRPLINFINKISDLLKVYRSGTLSADLYETCVDKIVNDYSSYSFDFDNFLSYNEALEAEEKVHQHLCELDDHNEVEAGIGIYTTSLNAPGTRLDDVRLYISDKTIQEFNEL